MTKERIFEELRKLKHVFDDPEVKSEFEYYNKTIRLSFPDIDIDAFLQIGNSAVDSLGVGIADTELVVTMDTSVFFGVLDKSIDPADAYSRGKIEVRGDIPTLMKLKKLLV